MPTQPLVIGRSWVMIAAPRPVGRSGLLEAAAGDLGAGADGDIDPRIRVPHLLGFAGAGMRRGLAVVLRRGRNAKALLGRELRCGRRPGVGEERQRYCRGESGGGK